MKMITAIGTPATVDPTTARKAGELTVMGLGASASSAPAAKMNVTSVITNGAIPRRVIQNACQRPHAAPARIVSRKANATGMCADTFSQADATTKNAVSEPTD